MFFLDTTFLGGKYIFHPIYESNEKITKVALHDGMFDKLFISTDIELVGDNFNDDWTNSTIMNADYFENLDAGNSGFSLTKTDYIIIKRRELLSDKWITVYAKKINKLEDFEIAIIDRYAKSETDYVYRVSSVLNGIENSYSECTVHSNFVGMYIVDEQNMFGTIFDVGYCDTTQNIKNQVLSTYDKYATVVTNSDTNYESGNCVGTFIKINIAKDEVDAQTSIQYRKDVKNRLASKKPFILKLPDGRIWMAATSGQPTEITNGHELAKQISFNWVEVGNYEDMETLYYSGLSDVDEKWWNK